MSNYLIQSTQKGEIFILSLDFGVFWVSSLGPIGFEPVQAPKVHNSRRLSQRKLLLAL
jgi:hypothetical protein